MNTKIEILKKKDIFKLFLNGKKFTKDEINKKYQHIGVDHLDKSLNVVVYNYFHLNWTENNIINLDFKDDKLINNLCGMCQKRNYL